MTSLYCFQEKEWLKISNYSLFFMFAFALFSHKSISDYSFQISSILSSFKHKQAAKLCGSAAYFTRLHPPFSLCSNTNMYSYEQKNLPNHNHTEIHLYSTKKQNKLSEMKPSESYPAAFLWLVPVVCSIESCKSYSLHNIHISYTVNH